MPALTIDGCLINISLNDDCITLYPKEMLGKKLPTSCSAISVPKILGYVRNMCNQIFLAEIDLTTHITTQIVTKVKATNPDYDRFIKRDDDDHPLYHKDPFDPDNDHMHLKFKSTIDKQRLTTLLEIIKKSGLITPTEQETILDNFDERYFVAKAKLVKKLNHNQKQDADIIKLFIYGCEDNDILTNLHEYLASPYFDYLRDAKQTPASDKVWLGCDTKGQMVETSEQWAMIEECITLKIADNIRKNCIQFSRDVAETRAKQFQRNYKFFSMCHTQSTAQATNSCFDAFSHHDLAALDKELKLHFNIVALTATAAATANTASATLATPKAAAPVTLFTSKEQQEKASKQDFKSAVNISTQAIEFRLG